MGGAAAFGCHDQRLDGSLLGFALMLCFRQLCDVIGRVLERDELATARQRDGVFEATGPTAIRLHAVVEAIAAFRFLRQRSRASPPRPVANSGRAAGSGVAGNLFCEANVAVNIPYSDDIIIKPGAVVRLDRESTLLPKELRNLIEIALSDGESSAENAGPEKTSPVKGVV